MRGVERGQDVRVSDVVVRHRQMLALVQRALILEQDVGDAPGRTSTPRGRRRRLLVALRTRNVQATQSSFLLFFPLLFLTPNFVPFDRLSPLMETLARINPVSYVIVGLRSLVIDGWDAGKLAACMGVIVGLGAVLTALSLRAIATYDRA